MPPKGKGMTVNQKRERLLRIFNESKEVYSYAQIEKIGEKAGIRRDTIKEILESLVSDTLVDVETLGLSKCYWSLPSQAYQRLKSRNEVVHKQLEAANEKNIEIQAQIEQMSIGRESTEQRRAVDKQLNELNQEYDSKVRELATYRRFDPDRLNQMRRDMRGLSEQTGQWQDDIQQLMYYLRNQGGMSVENLEALGLPQN